MGIEAFVVDSAPPGHPELKLHRIRRRVFHSLEEQQDAVLAGIPLFSEFEAARGQIRTLLVERKRTLETELERIDFNLEELTRLYATVDDLHNTLVARYHELVEKFVRSRSWPGTFHLGDLSVTNKVQPPGSAGLYEMALLAHPLADPFTPPTCALIASAMEEAGLLAQRQWYGVGHARWTVLAKAA